jgi:hypothetical protein
MTTRTVEMVGDLRALVPDFERSLRAANKAPKTVRIYGDAARRFAAFLVESGMPTQVAQISRESVETWIETQARRAQPSDGEPAFSVSPTVLQVARGGRRNHGLADGAHEAAECARCTGAGTVRG